MECLTTEAEQNCDVKEKKSVFYKVCKGSTWIMPIVLSSVLLKYPAFDSAVL